MLTQVVEDPTEEETRIASIARKQPSRFQHQAKCPFQTRFLHPPRGPIDSARYEVNGCPEIHPHRNPEILEVGREPPLPVRHRGRQDQDVRLHRADLSSQLVIVLGGKFTEGRSCQADHLESGITRSKLVRRLFGHTG
jgi:hypothetical protein